eukprot:gene16093-4665_t
MLAAHGWDEAAAIRAHFVCPQPPAQSDGGPPVGEEHAGDG